MGLALLILQITAATIFVVLMAIQTDKAEQSGVMGLGGQGGRSLGAIEMPVGAERILKPMSKWTAVAFLFLSALSAMQAANRLHWSVFVVAIVLYALVMLFGDRIWNTFTRLFGSAG